MLRTVLIVSTLLSFVKGYSQTLTPGRYQTSVFDSQSTLDVQYATSPQWVWPYWNVDLDMDIFEPLGDLNDNRPLIIFAHAGGFVNGSKDVDNMHAICDSFARKGFVTATIDYRKGFDPLDDESAERAVYRAVQDGKAAVRFFKENALTYKIDTNEIFFGGMSAGGFISYHVAYLDEESERPASTYGGGTVNDLGCLDCAGNNFNHTSEVKAVMNFWGATIDTTFMQTGDVPILLMHGTQDPTVPFGEGYPFGLPTLPLTYGSGPIKNQADAVGVEYEYYFNEMDIHMMDGSDNGTWTPAPNNFWGDSLLPITTEFIFERIKPNTSALSSDTVYLTIGETFTFSVSSDSISNQYVWSHDQQNVTPLGLLSSASEEFQFDNAGTYSIVATEYNHLLAAGDSIVYTAIVIDDASIGEQTSSFQVFPNPSTGVFQLKHDLSNLKYDLRVIDLQGKTVFYQVDRTSNLIDLSAHEKGVYILELVLDGEVSRLKVVLE